MTAFFRLFAWSVITAGVVVAALGAAGYWLYREAEGPGPLAEARTLVILPKSGIGAIGELLADKGVIRHGFVFQLAAGLSARGSALKAGEYEFPAHVSVLQALEIVAAGRMVKHRLTVPEGLTTAEVLVLVRDAPALDGDVGAPRTHWLICGRSGVTICRCRAHRMR
jgi:peptidoglycan lytic transglycosylase G